MARSFNGSSDLITVTNNSSLEPGTGAWSFGAWFFTSSSNDSYIMAKTDGSNPVWDKSEYALEKFTDNKLRILIVDSTSTFATNGLNMAGVSTINDGKWHHGIATFAGGTGTVTIYLDGASENSSAIGASYAGISGTTGNLQFGERSTEGTFWNGGIADAAVWAAQLTAGEVLALAKGARPWMIRPTLLKGWWPLDALQSPEPNLSGRVNSGTLTGTSVAASGPPVMMLTPRWPMVIPTAAAQTFQPAWAMRNRIVVEGIGI